MGFSRQENWPSEWTGWISLQSKGLSRVFSNTTVQKHVVQTLAVPGSTAEHSVGAGDIWNGSIYVFTATGEVGRFQSPGV